jgi:holo-[acyl-carrier protein] synthase
MTHPGIDLLEIDRLERALARHPTLEERLFSDAERAYAHSRARPAQHLAARWCAKEAVTKALGLTVFRPLDVEVLPGADLSSPDTSPWSPGAGPIAPEPDPGSDPRPRLRLHGAARRRAEELGLAVSVSLTHSRELAGAVAVAG